MTTLDWFGVALLVALPLAFLCALFFYLRTAYRKGGWREVKSDLIIAVVTLTLFVLIRLAQNAELQGLKDTVNRMTR
jgi:hypothetical protein